MYSVIKYSPSNKEEWDNLVRNSKNATFLHFRDYMEYHSGRFSDHSLLIYDKDKLISVLPANLSENTLISHGGLTYGGFIYNEDIRGGKMLGIFESFIDYCSKQSIKEVVYKAIPYIYHSYPSDEDLYALFRYNFSLVRRDYSQTISIKNRFGYNSLRKRSLKKALNQGIYVSRSYEFEEFMRLENEVLQKNHQTKAVHTDQEMMLLADRFPENIKLYTAKLNSELIAGTIIYESREVAHAQYIASSERGKECGAFDLIVDFLLSDVYAEKRYFDFGISTEEAGTFLNEGLCGYKESFGARGVAYDFYKLVL